MSEVDRTFVDAVLHGQAAAEDIDDWIDTWADADGAPNGDDVTLDEFLGFTGEEGALWVEEPATLRFIIVAHDRGRSVVEIMESKDEYALAARATDPASTDDVLQWLRTRGLVDSE